MATPSPLTLEGLAEVLRRHIEETAARSRDVDRQIQSVDGQVDALIGIMRDQGLRLTALAEQQAEQQTQIRQILHRLEQHDGRLEQHDGRLEQHEREFQEVLRRLDQHDVYIRRMLDLLERRGRDGGPAEA